MLNEDPVANRPSELDDGTLFKAIVVKYEVFGLSQSKVRQYDSFAFADARLIDEVDAFEQLAVVACLFDFASRKRG